MRKFLLVLAVLANVLWFFPSQASAANDFATDYNVTVDINTDNVAHVTQQITITNLQSGTYAKEYALTVSTITPENLKATNQQKRPLETETKTENGATAIKVLFPEKVIGLDKSIQFTLEYDTKDMVRQEGAVKTVIVPRIAVSEGLRQYQLTVQFPKEWGKAALSAPKPAEERETFNKYIYTFAKDDFISQGLVLIFGENQYFRILLPYTLLNPNLVRVDKEILLVPTTPYQFAEIESIEPKPNNIKADEDGNWIATYTVDRGQELKVVVTERVKLSTVPQYKSSTGSAQPRAYTKPQPHWETDQGKIMDIVKQLFGVQQTTEIPTSATQQTALKIFQFVVATLKYNPQPQEDQNDDRGGAIAALQNPTQAQDIAFADLFVTLARAANIPARVVIGFVSQPGENLTTQDNGPLPNNMHAWAEYYDAETGWVPVDPLWTSTAGGIDYFSHWDLQHVALAFWGVSDDTPYPFGLQDKRDGQTVQTLTPIDTFEEQKPNVTLRVHTSSESLFGIPGRAAVIIENSGRSAVVSPTITIAGKGLRILGDVKAQYSVIPPLSTTTIPFTYQTPGWFRFSRGSIVVTFNDQTYDLPLAAVSFQGRLKTLVGVPAVAGVSIGILIFLLYRKRRKRSAMI